MKVGCGCNGALAEQPLPGANRERIVWLYAAHSPALKAGVAWYGRLVGDKTANQPTHPVDLAARIKVPVLGLYGGADTGIPVSTIEQMRAALGPASASRFQVYADAPHAFLADCRPSYREVAATDGWRRWSTGRRKMGSLSRRRGAVMCPFASARLRKSNLFVKK